MLSFVSALAEKLTKFAQELCTNRAESVCKGDAYSHCLIHIMLSSAHGKNNHTYSKDKK